MKDQPLTRFLRPGFMVGLALLCNDLVAQPSGQRLKDLAPPGFYVGGTLGMDNFNSASCLNIAKSEFNILTVDNDMKPYGLHPAPDTYTWANADQFVNFCQANNIAVHGHTFLYPAFGPDWLNNLTGTAMVNAVNGHIDAVAARYRGKVAIWDVVNEATWYNWSNNTAGVWTDGPFQNYYDAFGSDFLADVFNRAHAADPNAVLLYNDNVHDSYNASGCEAVLTVLKNIKNNGGYINGVGLQCHYTMSHKPNLVTLGAYIDQYKALGLDVYFTEVDVDMEGSTDFAGQAQVYRDLMNLALSKGVKGFQTWGVYDGYSWLNGEWGSGPNSNPLLFDDNFQPKPAYYAVQQVLSDAKNGTSVPSGNQLVNPGFEATGNWEMNANFTYSTADFRTGSRSVQLQGLGRWSWARQVVSVSPQTTYTLAVYLKGSARTGLKVAGSQLIVEEYFAPTPAWTRYSVTFNSGTNTQVNVDFMDGGTGTTYLDDASLEPVPANLFVNPGFEQTGNWQMNSNFTYSTLDKRSGTRSLQLQGLGRYSWTRQVVNVSAQTTYTFSAYLKGSARTGLKVGGTQTLAETFFTPASGTWTRYSVTFNSGTNTQLNVDVMDGGTGTTYIDDVALHTGSSPAARASLGHEPSAHPARTALREGEVTLFPNPAGESVQIRIHGDQFVNVSLLSAAGKIEIRKNGLQEKQFTVPLSHLKPGVYFLKGETRSGKIVLKRFVKRN